MDINIVQNLDMLFLIVFFNPETGFYYESDTNC